MKTEEDKLIDEIIHMPEVVDRKFPVLVQNDSGVELVQYDPKEVVYGDTDSAYVSLDKLFSKETPPETVITFANSLAKTVNQGFPPFMRAVFNCNEEQSHMIETERELVSDKSYFIVKKNYIMHYIDKDGVAHDDYKVMGLATKRSDTPQIVKDFLDTMLHMLMDKKPFDDIEQAIVAFKAQYYQASFNDIGRPMAIKTLRPYEERYEKNQSMKGFSYHIRAVMYYNMMCGPQDLRINAGDKIRIVYIKDPDKKYIAIPADTDMLPEFVSKLEIDRDTQWVKVLKKINLYLIPIGLTYTE